METLEPEMAHHQGAATDIVVPNHLVAQSGEGITFTPVDLGERSATLIYLGPGHTEGDILVGIDDVLLRAVCWSRGPTHPLRTLSRSLGRDPRRAS